MQVIKSDGIQYNIPLKNVVRGLHSLSKQMKDPAKTFPGYHPFPFTKESISEETRSMLLLIHAAVTTNIGNVFESLCDELNKQNVYLLRDHNVADALTQVLWGIKYFINPAGKNPKSVKDFIDQIEYNNPASLLIDKLYFSYAMLNIKTTPELITYYLQQLGGNHILKWNDLGLIDLGYIVLDGQHVILKTLLGDNIII